MLQCAVWSLRLQCSDHTVTFWWRSFHTLQKFRSTTFGALLNARLSNCILKWRHLKDNSKYRGLYLTGWSSVIGCRSDLPQSPAILDEGSVFRPSTNNMAIQCANRVNIFFNVWFQMKNKMSFHIFYAKRQKTFYFIWILTIFYDFSSSYWLWKHFLLTSEIFPLFWTIFVSTEVKNVNAKLQNILPLLK